MRDALRAGIDIGSTRVRIAVTRRGRRGARVEAVAVRELPAGACDGGAVREPQLIAALVEEMRAELPWSGRACVCAVGAPAATFRAAAFPRMTASERTSAARLDAERRSAHARGDVVIRVRPIAGSDLYGVGVVERSVLMSRVSVLRDAGLRVLAVDHDALALLRCYDDADAVLDIGLDRTALHLRDGSAAASWWTPIGGAAVTAEIARDLSIAEREAEARKRIHGSGASADAAVDALLREVETLVAAGRRRLPIARLAMVGNASRLRGLRRKLASLTGAVLVNGPGAAIELRNVPEDIARAGMPDWSVAIGLSMWNG